MALLCFVLDLRSLPLSVLRDLKQSLFRLANYYAVKIQTINRSSNGAKSNAKPLLDRIGLCYVLRNRISCSDELKIAYNPHGNFNLRDFHHAVNALPTDAFSPEPNDSGVYQKLSDVLSEKIVYSWGDQEKTVGRKVIWISSGHIGTMDSVTMSALMEAVEKRVHVDFILLQQTSIGDSSENITDLAEQIGSLRNCSFQKCYPNLQVLYGLVKRWFLELKDEEEEPLHACFVFKTKLFSTLNKISCNLCRSYHPIADEFKCCQTCRCHGIPVHQSNMDQNKGASCPVTNDNLGAADIVENSVKVEEHTILHMPSFQDCLNQNELSSPINFNVIQRTNLGTLSEGLITGGTYFVTPSTFQKADENDNTVQNDQLFHVACSVLNSLDQGLVCSSDCNIETARVTSFRCYYILLPSDKGLMLLRRLAASEEFLPIPSVKQFLRSVAFEEIEKEVQSSLLKIEISDYNPVQHERGFHKKLNFLVKESLQFGAIHPKDNNKIAEPDLDQQNPAVQPTQAAITSFAGSDELSQLDTKQGETKTGLCLAEEWEKLIVTELGGMNSPTCTSNSKLDQLVTSPSQSNKQLDEKTSRILERLEVPRQLKRKAVSPMTSTSLSTEVSGPVKKPLIPYLATKSSDQVPTSSQPLKPNFQRIKRKR